MIRASPDRVGPRATVLGGLAIATGTFLAYPFVTTAWEAVVAGGLLGVAAGGWLTGQSVLLAALVPRQKRHIAFAQQRVAVNLGLGLGGLAGGCYGSSRSTWPSMPAPCSSCRRDYLASAGISWQVGFVVGPAAGAALLELAPAALWAVSAGVCFFAAVAALRLGRALPAEVSITARSPR